MRVSADIVTPETVPFRGDQVSGYVADVLPQVTALRELHRLSQEFLVPSPDAPGQQFDLVPRVVVVELPVDGPSAPVQKGGDDIPQGGLASVAEV